MKIRVLPLSSRALVAAVLTLATIGMAATPSPAGAQPAPAQPAPVRGGAAPRTFTITGVVRDSASGEVLRNARVGLVSSPRAILTNVDGRFALLGVPEGPQTLRVQYVGYASRLLPLRPDTVTGALVVFLAKAVVRLSTATVQSAIDQSPTVIAIGRDAGVQSISTAQVEAMPSVGEADVFRTLQMLPSVAGAGNGGASLSVRGGTPDQNLVLLDGITVYHVDHFFGLFSAFNTDALKDIQLYAGGFPARYGGRVSSVIDLTGKAGDERHFRASGGASLLSARGVVEIPLGRGSLLLSGRRSYTDVIKSGLYSKLFDFARQGSSAQPQTQVGFGGGGPRGGGRFQQVQVDPSFYFYDLNAKLTYRPSSKDVATISVFRGLDNLDQSQTLGGGFARFNPGGAAPPTTATTPTLNDLTIAQNTGVSARWFRQWSSRVSSDLIASSSEYLSDGNRTASGGLPNGGARFDFGFTETNTVEDRTVRLENVVDLAASSRLEFGGWATRNTVTYRFAVGSTTDTVQNRRNTVRNGDANVLAAYAQHTWTPVPQVDITTGVRRTQYDATGESFVEPRFNAGW
ncbi:MAG: TonB-dependent receptor plug domain-containing protein [Gemmatimonadota bacterium]|nr:TonB-dependent receptor plug domain-containing protein [Gemmatimonadota bacterium]